MDMNISKLNLKIHRKYLQGGLTNTEYDVKNLTDWRLQHHIITDYVKIWKNYEKVGNDSKFTDIQSKNDTTMKAEGKKMTDGVTLCPSRDVGAGRKFNNENLQECFSINKHYFLYDRKNINDEFIEFTVYWIPIDIIQKWYNENGNSKGKISKNNLLKCLNSSLITDETYIEKQNKT